VARLYEGNIPAGKYNFRFPLSDYNLSNGIYLLEVSTEKHTQVTKLIRY
jgi:hypothetical protein